MKTRALRRPANQVRPVAEFLEHRESPSSLTDPLASVISFGDLFQNQAPRIEDFRAIVGPNGEVTFTGRVVDDQAVAGTLVRIAGTGIDLAAIVGADGTFSATTTVFGLTDITVTATATDALGLVGPAAQTLFTPALYSGTTASRVESPRIALGEGPSIVEAKAISESGKHATLVGSARDDKSLAGCIVSATGDGVNETGLIDAKGSFSLLIARPHSGDFVVNVTVTDSDGYVSPPVAVLVMGA